MEPDLKDGRENPGIKFGRREDPFEKQLTQSLRTLYESYADWETGNLMSWSWAMTGLRATN